MNIIAKRLCEPKTLKKFNREKMYYIFNIYNVNVGEYFYEKNVRSYFVVWLHIVFLG